MQEAKPFWASRTLWLNFLVAVGLIVQAVTGEDILDPQVQGAIIVIANVVLRLITKQELTT